MKKVNILALALAASMVLAGCDNANNKASEEPTTTAEETAPVEEAKEETSKESAESEAVETEETTSEEEANEEENASQEAIGEEGELVLHRSYPGEAAGKAFTTVVVATSGDKIVDAVIDEYQFFDKDSNYASVAADEAAFNEGFAEGKILGSKIANHDAYSAELEAAGGNTTLLENYNAVADFVKGKTIAELEDFLANNDHDAIMDAVSGATFNSTPNYIQMIIDTAKDKSFTATGMAENLDDVELRYAIGNPHGDKSFANAVVAVEGDKILAASFDEFQFLENAKGVPGSEGDLGAGYADSSKTLSSKLENSDMYSEFMAEKAGSTVTIKDNFAAIENFVAGKTVEEIKEVIAGAEAGKAIDAVTGATLVDTAGYLQFIVDTVENNIRIK